MIHLDEDVILDLLPLYFAGEASEASRRIIDAYFAAHPEFADTMRAAQANSPLVPGAASPNSGHAAITTVKKQLKWRAALIAIAIFCSISPFTFVYDGRRLVYFAWRDAPTTAAVYASVAALAWIALWLSVRRTKTP
jgi:hypothetical protein